MDYIAPLPAPDFKIVDTDGQTVDLAGFLGRQHVVLVFLRGFA